WTTTEAFVTVRPSSAAQETQQETQQEIHLQEGKGWFGAVNGATGTTIHCTLRWHASVDVQLICDMPACATSPTSVWRSWDAGDPLLLWRRVVARPATTKTPSKKTSPRKSSTVQSKPVAQTRPPTPTSTGGTGHPDPWLPVPGHPSYGMSDFAGDPFFGYFGVCTWYAWYRHQSEPLLRMGNAASWPFVASHFGLRVGSTPVVGATAVFQAGVAGAGGR